MFYQFGEYKKVQQLLYKDEFEMSFQKTGVTYPKPTDCWISFVSAVCIYWGERLFVSCVYPYFFNHIKEKDEDIKVFKSTKGSEKLYCTIYFSAITYYGYHVLSKTDYLPPMLLGNTNNKMENMYINFPIIDDPEYESELKTYFLTTFGYHILSIYKLFRNKSRPDFMEMLLHHSCTLLLYFGGYTTNWIKFGSLIMFLHDWADVPTTFLKCVCEIEFKELVWTASIFNIWCWGYSRLYVFP